jgi:predicted O-methyltransferase YrrM
VVDKVKRGIFEALPPVAAEAVSSALLLSNPLRRRRMRRDAARCDSVQDWLGFGGQYLRPGAAQVEAEAVDFFEYAAAARPRRVCEIGTLYGGNTLIMSRMLPVEQLIGVDLRVRYRSRLKRLVAAGQRISLIDGSTTDPATLATVERLLDGDLLDLLFIDGDHEFAGARSDFLTYRHLVRPGGMIVFHDIQPDGREQGIDAGPWAGGVPVLWRLIRDHYATVEFIADRDNQLGYGIGVITYSPDVQLTEADLPAPQPAM